MHQAGKIIENLHNMGIAHRDLKPEKLLLESKNDTKFKLKLCDLGFARTTAPASNSDDLKLSDILLLGVIMYILCCGYPPPIEVDEQLENLDTIFAYPEWEKVSMHAKELIGTMLKSNSEKQVSIEDVMSSDWMKNYDNLDLKKRSLDTAKNLQKFSNMLDIGAFVDSYLKYLRDQNNVELDSQDSNLVNSESLVSPKVDRKSELKKQHQKHKLHEFELEEKELIKRQQKEIEELQHRHERERKEFKERREEYLYS